MRGEGETVEGGERVVMGEEERARDREGDFLCVGGERED